MITSSSNSKIRLVRSLARRREREKRCQFVIEGVRLVEDAHGAGALPVFVLYTASTRGESRTRILLERIEATLAPHTDLPRRTVPGESPGVTDVVFEVSDAVMRAISSTETPQGILAVVPFPQIPEPAHPSLILILDSIRDPGNLGTILRSARGVGVDEIWLAPGTVDLFNDKVVRAAMGAHFSVSIRSGSWARIAQRVQDARCSPRIYLADAEGEIAYTAADWRKPLALIVGNEAEGATEEAKKIATARVRIPLRGGESLNAAMAATLLMFEAMR